MFSLLGWGNAGLANQRKNGEIEGAILHASITKFKVDVSRYDDATQFPWKPGGIRCGISITA